MITRFSAKNYGCLKDLTCALTPLHAFIGPNDSGKSTLLRAIVSVVNAASGRTLQGARAQQAEWPTSDEDSMLSIHVPVATPIGEWKEAIYRALLKRVPLLSASTVMEALTIDGSSVGLVAVPSAISFAEFQSRNFTYLRTEPFQGARLIAFDPDRLSQPSANLPDGQVENFFRDRGAGLAGACQRILNRGDESWADLRSKFVKLFPTTRRVGLHPINDSSQEIEIELMDGTEVRAAAMSAGMLYWLGYSVISYLGRASVLAVEEPENGLHPSRIAEVVRILRALVASGIQVIVATHSPLVINELQPEEVSVVTRTAEAGTRVTPIKDTPRFESRAKVYALGELWLSYANGVDESPLLEGGSRPDVMVP